MARHEEQEGDAAGAADVPPKKHSRNRPPSMARAEEQEATQPGPEARLEEEDTEGGNGPRPPPILNHSSAYPEPAAQIRQHTS